MLEQYPTRSTDIFFEPVSSSYFSAVSCCARLLHRRPMLGHLRRMIGSLRVTVNAAHEPLHLRLHVSFLYFFPPRPETKINRQICGICTRGNFLPRNGNAMNINHKTGFTVSGLYKCSFCICYII